MARLVSTVLTSSKGTPSGNSSPTMTRPGVVWMRSPLMRQTMRACRSTTPASTAQMTSPGSEKILPSPSTKLRSTVR